MWSYWGDPMNEQINQHGTGVLALIPGPPLFTSCAANKAAATVAADDSAKEPRQFVRIGTDGDDVEMCDL